MLSSFQKVGLFQSCKCRRSTQENGRDSVQELRVTAEKSYKGHPGVTDCLKAGLRIGFSLRFAKIFPSSLPENPQNWNCLTVAHEQRGRKGREIKILEILQVPGTFSDTLNSVFFLAAPQSYEACFLLFY